jgi:hypothetical protein
MSPGFLEASWSHIDILEQPREPRGIAAIHGEVAGVPASRRTAGRPAQRSRLANEQPLEGDVPERENDGGTGVQSRALVTKETPARRAFLPLVGESATPASGRPNVPLSYLSAFPRCRLLAGP